VCTLPHVIDRIAEICYPVFSTNNERLKKRKEDDMLESKDVICISCKEQVTVKLVEYGSGYVATCPKCGKLAYNQNRPK